MSALRTGMVAVLLGWVAALSLRGSLRRVRGDSMQPTLQPGDLVLALPLREPRRGEVVVLRDPRNGTHAQIKRVGGLPGDTVAHRHGPMVVPDGHVAVFGDAPLASTDSRTYGPVPLGQLDRRVPLRLLPRPRLLTGR